MNLKKSQDLLKNHPFSIIILTISISVLSTYYFILGNPLDSQKTKTVVDFSAINPYTVCTQNTSYVDGVLTDVSCTMNRIIPPPPQQSVVNGKCPPPPACSTTN
jgi:hypothetical protein